MFITGELIDDQIVIPDTKKNNPKEESCEHFKKFWQLTKKDTKTTAVCDVCAAPTCSKHYTRVCNTCYNKRGSQTEILTVLDESNNPSTSGLKRGASPTDFHQGYS